MPCSCFPGAPGIIRPAANDGDAVKTYPDVSAHCLKEKKDLSLRLWYLLRVAAPCGWLHLGDVYHVSCGNRRQTRRWLAQGMGTFWHVIGDRLYMHSLAKVCQALGVKPAKRPVAIFRGDIESLSKFRAMLFASWFADAKEGRVISQAMLSKIFGRTPRTLRTWARLAKITVIPNLATAPVPNCEDELKHYPAGTLETLGWGKTWMDNPDDKPNLVWFERLDDELLLVWKMANTYICTMQCGPKTTLQKKAARHVPDYAAGTPDKLYWRKGSKANSIARALQAGRVAYEETERAHPKTGERLWYHHAA